MEKETTIVKIDEVSFEKTTPQPDLVVVKTLDDLLVEQASLETGIKNNQDAIIFQQAKLDEVNKEILEVKNLGIKTADVIQSEKIITEKVKLEETIIP